MSADDLQPSLRGAAPPLRDRAPGAAGVAPTALRPALIRALITGLLIGLFLSLVGAYGMERYALVPRTTIAVAISILASLLGLVATRLVGRWWAARAKSLQVLAAAVLMGLPLGLVTWAVIRLAMQPDLSTAAIPIYLAYAFGGSVVFCAIMALRGAPAMRLTEPADTTPKFLERLPLKLRGAEVWAVEAEDHYLRLHTSKGQDLIHMRLSDAVAELEGIEGAQVHRSWWVARNAIVGAKRGQGRAVLTLTDGSKVPVSRSFAGTLRERRWI